MSRIIGSCWHPRLGKQCMSSNGLSSWNQMTGLKLWKLVGYDYSSFRQFCQNVFNLFFQILTSMPEKIKYWGLWPTPSPRWKKNVFLWGINQFWDDPLFLWEDLTWNFLKNIFLCQYTIWPIQKHLDPSRHHCIPLNGAEFVFMDGFQIFATSKNIFLILWIFISNKSTKNKEMSQSKKSKTMSLWTILSWVD
jgi:hypothetical protein